MPPVEGTAASGGWPAAKAAEIAESSLGARSAEVTALTPGNPALTAGIAAVAAALGARPEDILPAAEAVADRLRRNAALAQLRHRADQGPSALELEQKSVRDLAAEMARRLAIIAASPPFSAAGAASYFRLGDWLRAERSTRFTASHAGRLARYLHRTVTFTDYPDIDPATLVSLREACERLSTGSEPLEAFTATVDRLPFRALPAGALASWPDRGAEPGP